MDLSASPTRTSAESRALSTAMKALLVAYLALIVGIMLLDGVKITPDLFLVFVSVIAVMLGMTRTFLRDWVPFVIIFLGWEAMRGLADRFGATVQSDAVIAVERLICFGTVPTVDLQRWLYHPGQISVIDWLTSSVYAMHFLFPLTVAFLLWLRARSLYFRFVSTLLAMSLVAFAFASLLPVAPPRYAWMYGENLHVYDIAPLVGSQLTGAATWIYLHLNGNPVAAFPSLHAAYPFLAFLFLREQWPRAAWLMLAYSFLVWFSIVYLGEHYVVDILGGVILALGTYYASKALWRRWAERRAAASTAATAADA